MAIDKSGQIVRAAWLGVINLRWWLSGSGKETMGVAVCKTDMALLLEVTSAGCRQMGDEHAAAPARNGRGREAGLASGPLGPRGLAREHGVMDLIEQAGRRLRFALALSLSLSLDGVAAGKWWTRSR